MTTNVTVKTADWPVEVTLTDHACAGEACTTERVEPQSERTFHIHSGRSIGLVELPKPDAVEGVAEPAADA